MFDQQCLIVWPRPKIVKISQPNKYLHSELLENSIRIKIKIKDVNYIHSFIVHEIARRFSKVHLVHRQTFFN